MQNNRQCDVRCPATVITKQRWVWKTLRHTCFHLVVGYLQQHQTFKVEEKLSPLPLTPTHSSNGLIYRLWSSLPLEPQSDLLAVTLPTPPPLAQGWYRLLSMTDIVPAADPLFQLPYMTDEFQYRYFLFRLSVTDIAVYWSKTPSSQTHISPYKVWIAVLCTLAVMTDFEDIVPLPLFFPLSVVCFAVPCILVGSLWLTLRSIDPSPLFSPLSVVCFAVPCILVGSLWLTLRSIDPSPLFSLWCGMFCCALYFGCQWLTYWSIPLFPSCSMNSCALHWPLIQIYINTIGCYCSSWWSTLSAVLLYVSY